ncbi:hypothetical protein [Ornithinibacillus halotolerans]|uniref:Uncharacterized protein n=1 Tax=Ornithinibacillus halotolerans TaxID=1274357 RepID=A0A916RL10_9BACI|nr:hypothetical protein [Ornithinibacillus halotolerans]GGA60585.1 hypothetical protein GCM10008025_00760 [Ornithinibacillus halotolerans]
MLSNKFLLLGIAIMLVAIYIQNSEGSRFSGTEIIFFVIGILLTIIGFFIKNQKQDG